MKRTIILFFAVITAFSAYSQNYLQDGDRCFDNGDYACAETKYDQASKSSSGNDKQIADIRLSRAKNCAEWIKTANQAFNNRNYNTAKENYQKVLDSNSKDEYAKSQLEKCNNFLKPTTTLSVSKENLSFSSSGGNESITVTTNASSYSINSLPSWCTVQKYAGYFVITCSANSGTTTRSDYFTVTAGDKTVRINVSQTGKTPNPPATTLSVSKENLSFSSSGGNESITVTTNASSYAVNVLSSWCTMQKYTGYFVITCSANSGTTTRTDYFTVTAGDKTVRVNVSQTGKTSTETTLSVTKETLSFSSSGGNSEQIKVYSSASSYSISLVPSWCSVQTHSGYFVVTCNTNYGSQSRSDWFKVTAGGKEIKIYVNQAGQSKSKKCFNCPEGDPRPLGLSLGYVQKQWDWKTNEGTAKYGAWDKDGTYLDGIQAGIRIEPLFKYGFGLSTGLFYEYYFSKSDKQTGTYSDAPGTFDYNMNFSEHSLYLPLHLEYRANISENFQFFVEAGPSIDYGLSAKLTATEIGENTPFYTETDIYRNSEIGFPSERFNVSLDFGAGIRLGGLQLNVGTSRGLMNISNNPNISIKQNKPLMASLSWMISHNDNNYNIPVNSIDKSRYRTHGIILEYISKQWEYKNGTYTEKSGLWEDSKSVPGFRLGYVYQPQFICGFGLRTGLNLDTYISVSDDMYDDYGSYYWLFWEMAINLPIHAEYRLHLSKNFSVFFETGPSVDFGLFAEMESHGDADKNTESDLYGKSDWGYPSERFNYYWDFIGGIRIKNIQLQIGTSRGLNEVTIDNGWKARQNKNLSLGISWFL